MFGYKKSSPNPQNSSHSNSQTFAVHEKNLEETSNSTAYGIDDLIGKINNISLINNNFDNTTVYGITEELNNKRIFNHQNNSDSSSDSTSDISINSNQDKMTDTEVAKITELYNALRIPDVIKDLPKFSGSKHTLFDFIENVDDILDSCTQITGSQNGPRTFLRAIRNKIIDEADEVLNMYGTPLDWGAIKENLITHYTDKRNETSLIRDLHTIYQGNDTVEKYFSRIIDIQSTIINQVKLNNTNPTVVSTKQNLYEEMCLATFLAGLKEPLGSMIRAMQPTTINEAFNHCIKEQNMHYIKNKSSTHQATLIPSRRVAQQIPNFGNQIPQQFHNSFQPRLPISRPEMNRNNFYQKPFPNQNYNERIRPIYNQNYHQPKTHNPLLKPQQAQPYRKLEPMDTTSNKNQYKQPTRFPNQNFGYNKPQNPFQSSGPPRFQSQELFHMENYTDVDPNQYLADETPQNIDYLPSLDHAVQENFNYQYESQTDENFYPEIDDQVFQELASENQSGS